MAETSSLSVSPGRKLRWYLPTPPAFVFIVLAMQGVLFLSAHYRWFWFHELRGCTLLVGMAATIVALLLFGFACQPRWYGPTPAKFLFAVLVMQVVLFLSAHYRWFWFNERKGYTVLISVAATTIALLLLVGCVLVSRFFKSKTQFGLATLLLMVPVVAIPFAWLAPKVQQVRQQRDLLKFASYAHTYPEDVPKNWITETLGTDFFDDVIILKLAYGFTDADILKLKALTKLESLQFEGTEVTDAGFEHLKELEPLQFLAFTNTQITGAGLRHLKGLSQLRGLTFEGTRVTDGGLEDLKELTQLQQLCFFGSQVTDEGLEHIKGLTQLQSLALLHTQVTDAGLEHLRGLTQLQCLDLRGTTVTDAGLEHLTGLTQLQYVSLNRTQVTEAGLKKLQEALPNCKFESLATP